jgi:hormone-sensitive lipase
MELLGSTGENIVFGGDSAGGNLNTACVVKCIEMGIRKPRGLFNAYTPFLVNFASSPARFLSLVDPLLPYGFIMRVFKSYGAVDLESIAELSSSAANVPTKKEHEVVEDVRDDNLERGELLSPDSSKNLEAMWNKIKSSAEEAEWQTNLGSIRETPSEEPSSPFDFGAGSAKLDDTTDEVDQEKAESSGSGEGNSPKERSPTSTRKPNCAYDEKYGNLIPRAPDDEFVFSVPTNQYLSPYWASSEVLKEFPATKILTTIVDPCIDDCVEFSKKLKSHGVDIHLDVLEGLNHGFLNFAQVSCDECFER